MARKKQITVPGKAKSSANLSKPVNKRLGNAERSAYFARREAAKVLRIILQGDARRQAVGTVKSLIYSPSIRNKKATYALVCQTLRHLPVIKDVLENANVPSGKWKRQKELIFVITYDVLFGQEVSLIGDAEKYLMLKKNALQSVLRQILVRKGVKTVEDLKVLKDSCESEKPRFVRVNTLKMDTESVIRELEKQYEVKRDDLVPDLLILPSHSDLHRHHLVLSGTVFLQGKASSMTAVALGPKPGWEVIDACAAPGNKTIHLAALMQGKGKILACELNKERVKRLEDNIILAGALNVEVKHGDFLNLDPSNPSYSKVRAILLDPSCSGSGTIVDRLDHLLPSYNSGQTDDMNLNRLRNLSSFQKRVLEHALSFPSVEKIVYSTCSINQSENEDVVESVLHLASSCGFRLETIFPQWSRRGLPTFEGSEHLLRTDVVEDKEGFFIALFVRKRALQQKIPQERLKNRGKNNSGKSREPVKTFVARMLKLRLHPRFSGKRSKTRNNS